MYCAHGSGVEVPAGNLVVPSRTSKLSAPIAVCGPAGRQELAMNTRAILSVAVLTCLMSPAAFAQTSTSGTGTTTREPPSSSSGMSSYDQETAAMTSEEFVKKAAEANASEIASRLALDQAQDPAVKSFAQQMINDHTKAGEQLKTIANSKGHQVPDSADMTHKTAILELKAKSGHAFDTAYTEQMRRDHANAIELFSNAANSSQLDPESRQFAKQTLPTLQHHPQLAMQDLPKAGG